MKRLFAMLLLPLLLLIGCDTLGPILGAAQPACEPSTGQTYTVHLKDKAGTVVRAATPDPACVAPAAASRVTLQFKVLCLVSDGTSLKAVWDADSNSGVAQVSSTKLPGCAK